MLSGARARGGVEAGGGAQSNNDNNLRDASEGDLQHRSTCVRAIRRRLSIPRAQSGITYRGGNKGLYVLLSMTQAGPGRTVKQEQEEISRNHVQTFISPSVYID